MAVSRASAGASEAGCRRGMIREHPRGHDAQASSHARLPGPPSGQDVRPPLEPNRWRESRALARDESVFKQVDFMRCDCRAVESGD